MKFEFQNLGTIKKTTLDLRPLTVIVGPNNTNKTYLAYCVHGLMGSLGEVGAHKAVVDAGNGKRSVDMNDVVAEVQSRARDAAMTFAERLPEYFQDTYGQLFKGTKLAVHISTEDVRRALQRLPADISRALGGEEVKFTWKHSGVELDKMFVRAGIVNSVVNELAAWRLTLPAERNALIITYKMLSTRRYRVLRDRQRQQAFRKHDAEPGKAMVREQALLREQGDIRYPAPIEEFLDFLTDVELNAARPANDARSPFGRLARMIEFNIQTGHQTGFESTSLGGRELALTVSDQLRLDLYNASSSIKQLAPLLLYLRYRAAPNQTLIIDEPEMNLHPEGQAKLLEALAMLANLGVRVLLTTHSPYFMAHLNNLIAADPKSGARKKRQAQQLYMGDPAAFLSPDDVSAYEMRREGLVSLADPEYGIRWDTLSDVSAELQRRYFAIVEEPKGRAKAK